MIEVEVERAVREALLRSISPIREVEKVLSSHSIAADDSAEIDVEDGNYSAVVVTVSASYDANATSGVRVRWLYSPDGIVYDSVEDAEGQGNYEDLTFSAGSTRTRTILIPLLQNFLRVQIVNLDSSYAVIVDVWKTMMR